jgi:hypothetical protein
MSSPMRSRISPPAISNAGSVIPNKRKMYCPATAKLASTTKAVMLAFLAVARRSAAFSPSVTARNVGSAANGSTRKKMELSASKEKRTVALRSNPRSAAAWAEIPALACRACTSSPEWAVDIISSIVPWVPRATPRAKA